MVHADTNSFLEKLQPYTVKIFHLDKLQGEMIEIPARKLLLCQRFDLMAKTLYLRHLQNGFNLTYAKHAYCQHIVAMNHNHTEPGQPEKNSIEKFRETFEKLFQSFLKEGFQSDLSLIPLDCNNILLDGAHRVCCAAVLNQNVFAIRFPALDSRWSITAAYLHKNLLDEESIDAMSLEYVHWHKSLYMLCLWPSVSNEESWVAEKIATRANIVNRREMMLDLNQLTHLMAQVYMTQDWIGSAENLFGGVSRKSIACFKPQRKTVFYLLECSEFSRITQLKEEIRDHFQLGKHSVHITDNYEECCQIANIIFNPNSRHHLQTAFPFRFPTTVKTIYSFSKLLEKHAIEKNKVILDSGTVLGIYGLRSSLDIDFVADIPTALQQQLIRDGNGFIDSHDNYLLFHELSKSELLYHPLNYFTFMGLKFVSIPQLIKFKKRRAEPKDLVDSKILQQFSAKNRRSWRIALLQYQNNWLRSKRYWERRIKDNFIVKPLRFFHMYEAFSSARRIISNGFTGRRRKK